MGSISGSSFGGGGPTAAPGYGSGFTAGAIIFADANGALGEDPTVLFWDATLNRLGVGTDAPGSILHVTGSLSPAANANGYLAQFGGTLVEAASGTHAVMAGAAFLAPTVTAGAGAVTAMATLYVNAAPTGTATAYTAAAAIAPDTDALTIIGRTAIGSWVATDEVDIAHYDNRASSTGYTVRGSVTSTLINAPVGSGVVYLQLGGSFAQGWTVGDGIGVAHMAPLTTATFDLGTSALRPRDLYLSRDIEIDGALNHDGTTAGFYGAVPVVQAAFAAAASGGATIDAECRTLANALRTMAINLGLKAAA